MPAWTPDGKSVTFSSTSATGATDLWTQRADGGAPAVMQVHEKSKLYNARWSPDTKWLIFQTDVQSPGSGDILAIRPGIDYCAGASCSDQVQRNLSSPFTQWAMAGVRLERDRRGRDLRGPVSKHGHGKVGDFGGRRDGASLVPSRERVVLSRRLGQPCGSRGKYQSAILARPRYGTLSGREIHILRFNPQYAVARTTSAS